MKQNVIVDPPELMNKIVLEIKHYNEAIKNGKEFHEVKEIRQKIVYMVVELKEILAIRNSSQ